VRLLRGPWFEYTFVARVEALERFSKQLIYCFVKPQTSGVWLPTTIQKTARLLEASVLLQIAVDRYVDTRDGSSSDSLKATN